MNTITIESIIFQCLIDKVEELYILCKRKYEDLKLITTVALAWLDNEEAASILKVSKRTLLNYRQNGILAYSQIGKEIYYRLDDLEALLKKHYRKSYKTNRRDDHV